MNDQTDRPDRDSHDGEDTLPKDEAVEVAKHRALSPRAVYEVTLWHAYLSRSTRILWLLEEIGCAYRLETLPPSRTLDAALHPARSPTLCNGEVMMHETGAMAEFRERRGTATSGTGGHRSCSNYQ